MGERRNRNSENKIPSNIKFLDEDKKILNSFSDNLNILRSFIDSQKLNEYIKFVVDKSFEANKYFNDQSPWSKKDNVERMNTIVYVSLEIIRKLSILLMPIMPETSLKSLKSISVETKTLNIESIKNHLFLIKDTLLNNQGILFKKIEKNND